MLQKILALVARPPVPLVAGTLLLLAVVWFGAGVLHDAISWPSPTLKWIACALILLGALGYAGWRVLAARRRAQAIEREIKAQARAQIAANPALQDRGSDIAALQQRFDQALDSLKSSKLGRGALYALPWYVIIGPPGSGKTTAITESGLNFPAVSGPNQKRGIRGLGGTRNCDWWFTDQMILLDTAGRYTTQAEDREEWHAFLGMIKKARKLKPINGVVVAISIMDVLTANEEGLERHANTIRQRIDELVKQLEVVFPVYLVFTKCDLLDGFVEFFSGLSKDGRGQVWGATFDLAASGDGSLRDRFVAEFDLLCLRIGQERLRLLVADRPQNQQRKIFSLALQLTASRKRLAEFVELLTQPNPYSEASPVRGVYLTSGTQEGAPIDQVMQRLASAHGIQVAEKEEAAAVEAKSYFVRDLFTKVMVTDRELARSSAAVQRRREWTRRGILIGSGVAAVLLAIDSVLAYSRTAGLVGALQTAVKETRRHEVGAASDAEEHRRARAALDQLRERYLALQAAYSGASVLGPDSDTVLAALGEYVGQLRPVFLEPIRDAVQQQLKAFVDAPTQQRDYAEIKQLLIVRRALADEYVPTDVLGAALRARLLWRWTPAEIGTDAPVAPNDPLMQHLAAFLATRDFEVRVGRTVPLGIDLRPGLPEQAQSRLNDGPGMQAFAARTLQQRQDLRTVTDNDLIREAKRLYEQQVGALDAAEQKQFEAAFTTQRKAEVLQEMSDLHLADTSTIRKTIDSLNDLSAPTSAPVQLFRELLQGLRNAGAAPSASTTTDTVVSLYASALQQLETLKDPLTALDSRGAQQGLVLPDIQNGQVPLAEFTAKLDEVAANIRNKLVDLEKAIGSQGVETGRVYQPIQVSINTMRGSIEKAVASAVRRELTENWNRRLGTQLANDLQQFPFTPTGKDIGVARWQELFRRGGLIDEQLRTLDSAQRVRALATELTLSGAFVQFRRRCAAIQAAFYGDAGQPRAEPALLFHIAAMDCKLPINDITFTVAAGDEVRKRSTSQEIIRQKLRTWKLGTASTQLAHSTTLPGETFPVQPDERDSPWSLLHVLQKGEATWQDDKVRVTWTFKYQGTAERTAEETRSWIVFEALTSDNPFAKGFFELSPPDPIFQAERK